MTYYKATRPNGRDFNTDTIDYALALETRTIISHPNPHKWDASGYLSVATVPTDCTGMSWPCRLFEVEPVSESWAPNKGSLPNKVACHVLRVVREVNAVDALGPQGAQLEDLIGQARALTEPQLDKLAAARDAARATARAAAWVAAWDAARDAAWALSVRDLISETGFTQTHYDLLTGPWRKVVGKVHPDDAELT